MLYYKYYNREYNDIQKLKQNLMSKSNNTESSLSVARQAVNERLGKIFENNIRNILELKHGFKKIEHPDKIFMKKIIIDIKPKPKEMDILQEEEITIDIKDKKNKLLYDYEHNFLIKELNDTKIAEITSENSNKETKLDIDGTTIKIFPYKEIEFDGYYVMKNFCVNLFDQKEVEILYTNINKEEEEKFVNSIIEAKLSSKKTEKIKEQMRKDRHYLKVKGIKNSVILGFINSIDIKSKDCFNSLKNNKCVIYGIKKSILYGKEIAFPIDWDLEKRFCSFQSDVNKKLDAINKVLVDIKPKINQIYDKFFRNEEKKENEHKENEEVINYDKKIEESKEIINQKRVSIENEIDEEKSEEEIETKEKQEKGKKKKDKGPEKKKKEINLLQKKRKDKGLMKKK